MSNNVTFDESSILKTPSSQHMENGEIREISQQVESDASPSSPDSFVSFRVPSVVTQYKHRVQEKEDIEDVVEDQEPNAQFRILCIICLRELYRNHLGILIWWWPIHFQ